MKKAKRRFRFFLIMIPFVFGLVTSCPNPVNLLSVLNTLVAESSPPILVPEYITFEDTDIDNGQIAGTLSFPAAAEETGISAYHLYWGVSENQRLPGMTTPAAIFEAGSDTYQNSFDTNYPVPVGATHFMICSANESGESEDSVVLDIPDLSCEMLVEIWSGTDGGSPINIMGFDGDVYFAATDGPDDGTAAAPNGYELWSYNGTTAQMEWDLWNGVDFNGNGSPKQFHIFENKLFFLARTATSDFGLCSIDPRNGNAQKTYGLYADSPATGPIDNATHLTSLNDMLYITAFESGYGWEIYDFPHYYTMAVPQVGYRLTDTSVTDFWSLPFFANLSGTVYFKVDGGDGYFIELWKLDGDPPTGIVRVSDINPSGSAFIQWTVTYRDKLYLQATDDGGSTDLWSFDGSTPTLISDSSVTRGPTHLTVCNDKLYFHAYNSVNDMLLWEYDETSPPVPVTSDALRTEDTVPPIGFMGNVYFSARPVSTSDVELYVYDGTSVSRVKDINDGPGGSSPREFYVYQDVLYFQADDGDHGPELWGLWID